MKVKKYTSNIKSHTFSPPFLIEIIYILFLIPLLKSLIINSNCVSVFITLFLTDSHFQTNKIYLTKPFWKISLP